MHCCWPPAWPVAAGGTDEHHQFTALDVQVDASERDHLGVALAVALGDAAAVDRDTFGRGAALTRWRGSLMNAAAGKFDDPLFPALLDTIHRYEIPLEYFETAIDGVETDLARTEFATLAELEGYCYQVASVVGLACIHVCGSIS